MGDPSPAGAGSSLEGLLRERLGAGARIGALTFEGRLLHVEGARLPLGAHATLAVDHATLELGAGLPLGALPLAARLLALRGAIRAPGLAVPIAFTASEGGEPSWAHGTLRLGGAVETTLSALPGGVRLSGEQLRGTLAARQGGGLVVDLSFTGARSQLALGGAVDAGARLHDARLAGRLAVADVIDLLPAPPPVGVEAVVALDLAARGSLAEPELGGRVSADAVVLRREGAALHLDEVSATLEVDRRRIGYRDLRGATEGARFGGWGRVPLSRPSGEVAAVPLLALQIERAGAALLGQVAAWLGRALPRPALPPDLELTGELVVSAERAVSGSFALETRRSALLFHLALGSAGELLGSTVRGRCAAADASALGLPGPVRLPPDDVYHLDARFAGTLARPRVTGRLTAERASLELVTLGQAALRIEGLSVLFDAGPEGLAWRRLAGRLDGGSFSSSGRLGRGGGVLSATVAWSGVRVEGLPLPFARTLSRLLRGASSGELRFERESLAEHALSARGRVVLAAPVYLFVRGLAPSLARYGLPPLRVRGEGPVTALVRLDRGEIVVGPISASLDGIDVEGALRVTRDGGLRGRADVRLRAGYLARSPLLAVPAALSREVTLPVRIGGTLDALRVETDALEILDGLLPGSGVGDAVKELRRGLGGQGPLVKRLRRKVGSVWNGLRGVARAPRKRR